MPALRTQLLTLLFIATPATPLVAQIPDDVTLEEVLPTSTVSEALGVVNAGDGSDRLFVIRQNGIVEIVENDQVQPGDFLDITTLTSSSGERGLLGLAFHPQYESNGLLYVNFTANGLAGVPTGDTVIAEYQVSAGDPDQVDTNSRRILLTVTQDFSNHNGGNLAFGPDGYLYIGMGDGGSGGDPCNRAQTLDPDNLDNTTFGCEDDVTTALLGKMLRIDVDDTTPAGSNNLCAADGDGSAEYAVPADNPFAQDDKACGEVWAYGLRNPWRFSFDRSTGDIWIGDVGQGTWEEVNLEPGNSSGGVNYGWNPCEGEFATGSTSTACPLGGSELPVLSYRRNSGNCSVTGGYRYRGPVLSLQGTYIYGDYCSGRIWFAGNSGGTGWSETEFPQPPCGDPICDLRSFGEDEDGNLYVVRDGGIFRFEGDTTPPGLIFRDRFQQE